MKSNYFEVLSKVKTTNFSNGLIQKLFKTFKVQSILTRSNIKKEKGHSILQLIYTLFVINIDNFRSIYSGLKHLSCEKMIDPIMNMMGNINYDWKGALFRVAKVYEKIQPSTDDDKMIIIDDSSNTKTGKKVDFTSWFYNHAEDEYFRGFQTVMASYYNGFQSIPLSFIFKIGNYRKYNSKNIRKYPKGSKMRGIVRSSKKSKTQIVMQMLKQTLKRRFDFSYVLWDSWYTCAESIKFIFDRLVSKDIHLVSMVKRDGRYYHYRGKYYQQHQLFFKAGRNWNKIEGGDIKYKEIVVDYIDSRQKTDNENRDKLGKVKLVFVKYPDVEEYRILLSTDIDLNGVDILEKYLRRWSIEQLFKNLKQHFGYNQCMSGKYEVLVADFTIRCVFYIIMAYRREYYRSQSMMEVILEFYKEFYENTLEKLIQKVLYDSIVKIINHAKSLGIKTIKELENNLDKIFVDIFNRPIEKIVPD